MFPNRYFGRRYFCARYWMKLGAPAPPVTFNPIWAQGANRTVGFGIEPK